MPHRDLGVMLDRDVAVVAAIVILTLVHAPSTIIFGLVFVLVQTAGAQRAGFQWPMDLGNRDAIGR